MTKLAPGVFLKKSTFKVSAYPESGRGDYNLFLNTIFARPKYFLITPQKIKLSLRNLFGQLINIY